MQDYIHTFLHAYVSVCTMFGYQVHVFVWVGDM